MAHQLHISLHSRLPDHQDPDQTQVEEKNDSAAGKKLDRFANKTYFGKSSSLENACQHIVSR
jgi:hypothetical protein